MKQGELRRKLTDECPEEFLEYLEDWCNDLESLLSDALGNFDIDGVEDLHKIEDAKRAVEDIKDGMY